MAKSHGEGFAAIGPTDTAPAVAATSNVDISLAPPSPVHAEITLKQDGNAVLRWVRRARGGWLWLDRVEQALVEERELYQIGVGPGEAETTVARPATTECNLTGEDLNNALAVGEIWVRQVGTYARSKPAYFRTGH